MKAEHVPDPRRRGDLETTSPEFSLPDQGETYTRDIVQRCEDLIQARIWSGLEVHQLRAWLNTFDGPVESYFASCLLDALIYRSAPQTTALMLQLFQRTLPDLARRCPPADGVIHDWQSPLSDEKNDPGIRIIPVINTSDPPTKSGPLVCRLLKRHLGLSENWMIWPSQVKRAIRRGVRVFLFVDDFLGTGLQFRKFARSMRLADYASNESAYFVYAPLVAFHKGIDRLRNQFPCLSVATVEVLDDSYGLFSESSRYFNDGKNSPLLAKNFYEALLDRRGIGNLGRFTFGYARLGLAFAFQHATPNATLPLFWLNHDRIRPLFQR
jgi:hypothetical protein